MHETFDAMRKSEASIQNDLLEKNNDSKEHHNVKYKFLHNLSLSQIMSTSQLMILTFPNFGIF